MASTLPKTSKSQQTRAKIINIAKEVFSTKGYHNTTIKDITNSAGLGYGTFYLYFTDKRDIFNALLEQVEDDLYTAAEGGSDLDQDYERGRSSYRALRKDLRALFLSFKENASILRFSKELSLIDPEFSKRYEAMRSRLISRTEQILKKSGLSSVDPKIAAVAIAGMIEAVASEWQNTATSSSIDSELEIEDILPTLTKLYFKAVS